MLLRAIMARFFPQTASVISPGRATNRPLQNTTAIRSLYNFAPLSTDHAGLSRRQAINGQPSPVEQANRHYSSRGNRSTAASAVSTQSTPSPRTFESCLNALQRSIEQHYGGTRTTNELCSEALQAAKNEGVKRGSGGYQAFMIALGEHLAAVALDPKPLHRTHIPLIKACSWGKLTPTAFDSLMKKLEKFIESSTQGEFGNSKITRVAQQTYIAMQCWEYSQSFKTTNSS